MIESDTLRRNETETIRIDLRQDFYRSRTAPNAYTSEFPRNVHVLRGQSSDFRHYPFVHHVIS